MIILLPLVVLALVWVLVVPGQQFLSKFTRLLDAPAVQRGAFSIVTGRSDAFGTFQGREVTLHLQLKRSRYGQGYLVIGMRTAEPATLDDRAIDARLTDATARQALATLSSYDLELNVSDGWVRALWRPHSFAIFPGRFSEEPWRAVLAAMQALASSLEAASA